MEHAQQTYEIVSCLFTPCTNLKVSAAPDGVCNPIKRKTEKVRKRREPSAAEIGWPWPNKCQWHRFFGIIHREMVFPRQWQPGCPPPSHFCMDPSDSLLCWLREVAQLLPPQFLHRRLWLAGNHAKGAPKKNATYNGKRRSKTKKRALQMVQTFPSAPVTFFSFQGIKCKKFSQEKAKKMQKNAIYKGKKPF